MELLQRYKEFIKNNSLFQPGDKLLLAVSGGVDSMALCELTRLAGFEFVIAHCNFKLRGEESERDMRFVKEQAQRLGAECFIKEFNTKEYASGHKISIQEAARTLRYDWFDQLLVENSSLSCIVTAHHSDDNIETVLHNFFRGTGIKGLRGIEMKRGKIVRPLLFARRAELEEFVSGHGLGYVTDSSNLKEDYSRNYLRLSVIPMLEKIFPDVSGNILQNIDRFREAEVLYREAVDRHKKDLLEYKGEAVYIPVLKLKKSKPLRTLVYEITKEWGFGPHQVDDIIHLLDSETGKYISSATHRILKNRNWIIITPLIKGRPEIFVIEEGEKTLAIPMNEKEEQVLTFEIIPASQFEISKDNFTVFLDIKNIQYPLLLRKWKTGDYFYPLGNKKTNSEKVGKKKLSRFFIDQKLSKADKEKAWVLAMDQKILWVVGYRMDDRFKVTGNTKSVMKISLSTRQTV